MIWTSPDEIERGLSIFAKLYPIYDENRKTLEGVKILNWVGPNQKQKGELPRITCLPLIVSENNLHRELNKPRFKSTLMRFDIKRAYFRDQPDSNFFMIATVQFLKRFLTHKTLRKCFDGYERFTLINNTFKIVLNQVPFDMFGSLVVNKEQKQKRINHFKRREELRGHHIMDLYINDAINLLKLKEQYESRD